MTNWIMVASEKIKKNAECRTAKTDESHILAVLAVPNPNKSIFFTTFRPTLGDPTQVTLNNFLNRAPSLGVNLLHADVVWLKTICHGHPIVSLGFLLDEYLENWLTAMNDEPMIHKKENAGRYKANTKIRESINKAN